MVLQTLFYGLYIAGMAGGAFYFWSLSRRPKGVPQHEYLIAIFIPVWSGLAYLAMALGQGQVEVAGQIAYYARYLDWVVSTPLLLIALSLTAMQFIEKDKVLISALVGTQIIVILTGLFADLSERGWVRALWFLCGTVAFLIVLQILWGPLRKKARQQQQGLSNLYDRLLTYFTVLWISYPVVWIIGPSGLGLISPTLEVFLFCLLPFFSKVGFSVLDLRGLRSLRSQSGNRQEAAFRAVERQRLRQ